MSYLQKTLFILLISCTATMSAVTLKDGEWPHEIIVNNTEIAIFQPQIEEFKANRLTARSAVSVKIPNSKDELFCTVWFSAQTVLNKIDRIVSFDDVAITRLSFPGATEKVKNELRQIITEKFLSHVTQIELDRLLPMLENLSYLPENGSEIIHPVPKLFFSQKPAVLVSIDGNPKLKKVADKLLKVINTPFIILLDMNSRTYFLNCVNH